MGNRRNEGGTVEAKTRRMEKRGLVAFGVYLHANLFIGIKISGGEKTRRKRKRLGNAHQTGRISKEARKKIPGLGSGAIEIISIEESTPEPYNRKER